MASSSTSESTSDYELKMSTTHLLKQLSTDIRRNAPTGEVTIRPKTTWTEALATASQSLKEHDRPGLIFPQRSKEQREGMKKLALSEGSRRASENIARIRTTFPEHKRPRPARAGTKEQVRKLATEALAQTYREPYVSTTRLALTEGSLATASGSLDLEVIEAGDEEDDPTASCSLEIKDMLWDTGSHGCAIVADLLPDFFVERLKKPDNDPYCNESGKIVQVQGYVTLSNSEFYFDSVFTVVQRNRIPNRRSGVILGQKSFMDHTEFKMVPRAILESRGEEVKEDEWGDLNIIEWVDSVTGESKTF